MNLYLGNFNSGTNHNQRLSFLRYTVIVYSFMFAFTFAFALLRDNLDILHYPKPSIFFPSLNGFWRSLALGAVSGIFVSMVLIFLSKRVSRLEKIVEEVKILFEGFQKRDILMICAISSLCEESFFRGILQPLLGIVLSSLIFGIAHIPRNRIFALWTIEATLLGFWFGFIYEVTGNLAGPIAGHFIINYLNISYIVRSKSHLSA